MNPCNPYHLRYIYGPKQMVSALEKVSWYQLLGYNDAMKLWQDYHDKYFKDHSWQFAKLSRISRKKPRHDAKHSWHPNFMNVNGCYDYIFADGSNARKFFKRQYAKRSRVVARDEIWDQQCQDAELNESIIEEYRSIFEDEENNWFDYEAELALDDYCKTLVKEYYDHFDDPFHDEDFSIDPFDYDADWYDPSWFTNLERGSIDPTEPAYINLYLAGKTRRSPR